LNTHLVDSIQGLADLVAVGQMEVRRRQTHALTRALAAQQLRLAQIDGLADALANGTLVLTTLAVLLVGIPLVRVSSITGIDLAVLVLVTIASFEAVLPLPAAFLHLESCLTAGRRLFEIVDQKPAVIAPSRPAEEPGQIDLSIHDLHFAYAPGEQPALDGLSFDLPAGKRLAVVGPSGAGKTTIANLLLRFYEDEAGAIWLGGRPLRDYDPEMVRRLFAVIRQDTGLFNMTIRENLLLARPDASEPDLIAACQRAQIHEWIAALPAGCDTRVGEQGVKLSGGERQRVAIARAILKDAPVLLLDEPTANLDALSERAVMHTLLDILPGRSVLLITHRLVGLETFDEILVLVEGRIVERGTHAELLSQTDGLYHRMLTLQNEFLRETL
jgi:ATP-binding cassette subfamily C protein CydC